MFSKKDKSRFSRTRVKFLLIFVFQGKRKAINTEGKEGTKCAAHYVYHIEAGQQVVCKVRLYHAMEGPPHVRAFR